MGGYRKDNDEPAQPEGHSTTRPPYRDKTLHGLVQGFFPKFLQPVRRLLGGFGRVGRVGAISTTGSAYADGYRAPVHERRVEAVGPCRAELGNAGRDRDAPEHSTGNGGDYDE